MRIRNLFLTMALAFTAVTVDAQTSGFSYQAVVRNQSGDLVANKSVGIRITLTDSKGQQNFYSEATTAPTNAYGVLSVTIGAQDTTVLKSLNWSSGIFMRVEIDPAGGTTYTDMGLTPIQAVPYALYAANGGKGEKGDPGEPGPQGEPGTGLTNRGAWNSANTYNMGDYVFARSTNNADVNSMWIAQANEIQSNAEPYLDSENWVEFQAPKGDKGDQGEPGQPGPQGPEGPQGNPGTGLTNKGAWNKDTTYDLGDYVFARSTGSADVNSMWIAQANEIHSDVEPYLDSENWVEFQAQKGEKGEPGQPGPQGPQGPKGDDGMQVTGTQGQTLVHNGTTWVATDQLTLKKLDVKGATSSEEALFEVKDNDGNVVFAVYPNEVRVYVDENDTKDSKVKRSGLIVTGRNTKSDIEKDYLIVNPTGTQVFVDENDGKVKRSGLIVTGRNTKGDAEQDYLIVNPTGTQVIVDENDGKVKRSGLIVTGRNTKGDAEQD